VSGQVSKPPELSAPKKPGRSPCAQEQGAGRGARGAGRGARGAGRGALGAGRWARGVGCAAQGEPPGGDIRQVLTVCLKSEYFVGEAVWVPLI
jgi:hypothetical protein